MNEEKRLKELQMKTRRTLLSIKTVWPFKFFTDVIRIDENKVDIIYQNFFGSHYVFSVLINNINGVTVTTGIFFASLSIELRGYEKNPDDVHYLPKHDAERAKRIVLGLIAAKKEKIDVSKLPTDRLVEMIEEIGSAKV